MQRFAHNIAAAIRENASANVTSNTKYPPSMALMMGAESQDFYWHTILHGVAEINVETVLVKDDEIRESHGYLNPSFFLRIYEW